MLDSKSVKNPYHWHMA